MLEEVFQDVYTKFKLHFYQNVFQRFATREATLTTVESFCMEGIMAMGEPTIAEFSRMMGISTPNAAYKIGSLVKKGYVEKIQSTTDRREYFLRPTQKYIDYYSISYSYLHTVIERVRKRFPAEDCDKMEQMLSVISTELMPELDHVGKKVLVVHQQVIANSIRDVVREHDEDAEVTVASWFSMEKDLLEEGDVSLRDEDDYIELVENGSFDVIFADPCMKRMVPGFAGEFEDAVHFAVSGKCR